VRALWRSRLQGAGDQCFHLAIGDLARGSRPRFIGQTFQAGSAKPFPPFAHGLVGNTELPCHLAILHTVGAPEHDAGAQCQPLGGLGATRPLLELVSLVLGQHDWLSGSAHAGWILSIAGRFPLFM